jgi:multidrug efflux pump subunit AcrA (membrane-fusion protein)
MLQLQSILLGRDRLDIAATALATQIARLLGAARVTLGLKGERRCKLLATSQQTDVQASADRVRSVEHAMQEALDQAAPILFPAPPGGRPRITLAHAALAEQTHRAVLTVPLASGSRLVGAMTAEFVAGNTSAAVGDIAEDIAIQIAPVLELKHRAELSLPARVALGWRASGVSGNAETRWLRRAVWAAGIAAVVALFTVPADYRVGAPARLEGAVQRVLVAPVDGFLREVHVKPGDRVKEGQLLAELADQDLEIERNKWAAELSQHENNYRTSFARGDRTQYVVYYAKAQEAQAQLQLVEQQITRSRIRAPFDGSLIKGDLTQALGSPVKRGDVLLTVAPDKAYRLIVEVDERDIARVRELAPGALALSALPRDAIAFEVVRITPVATSRDGRNFYEVEGHLSAGELPLRPGLQGVAKIEAGKRTLAWIWGHRLVDWLRLSIWTLGG